MRPVLPDHVPRILHLVITVMGNRCVNHFFIHRLYFLHLQGIRIIKNGGFSANHNCIIKTGRRLFNIPKFRDLNLFHLLIIFFGRL